jgi:sugar phosphate isomerase/epimerase
MTDRRPPLSADPVDPQATAPERRAFLKGTTMALAGGLLASASSSAEAAAAASPRPLTTDEKLRRLATNTYPHRTLFKQRMRQGGGPAGAAAAAAQQRSAEMKQKYGEITLLDYPQWTRDNFPGIRNMDLWSSLFGDVTDDSMYAQTEVRMGDGQARTVYEFDPSLPSAKRWLDQLANNSAKTGVAVHHVSNNAPRNMADLDPAARKAGIEVAKKWLDGCAQIGAKTMRVNTGGPRIIPSASAETGYPRNDEIVPYLKNAIDSFSQMADYGGTVGVKVTIENHWGLSADPQNIRIILDEVNHPYCEASPDYCNWEHEFQLYHGLQTLMPYTHTTVHAKYWDRWENVDLQRMTRILTHGGFRGIIALEYEDGPWDGVEGSKRLMAEVLEGL